MNPNPTDSETSDTDATSAGEVLGPITVQLADGPAMVRGALASVLSQDEVVEVVAVTASAEETLRAAGGHQPMVIVYQPPLAAMSENTVEMLANIRDTSPGTQIIVLASSADPGRARDAINAGAAGYILGADDTDALIRAIHSVAKGKPVVNAVVALAIAQDDREEGHTWLSDRERQIVKLVALGFTNAEIGEEIHISGRTVETHRANILRKLELSSRSGLVRYAIDQGMFK